MESVCPPPFSTRILWLFFLSFLYLLQTDPRPFTLFPFAHHFLEPGEFVSVWLLSFSLPFKPRKLVFLSSLALALSRTGKEAPAHLLRGEQETVAFLEVWLARRDLPWTALLRGVRMLDGRMVSSPTRRLAVSSAWGVDSWAHRRILRPAGGVVGRPSWRVLTRSLWRVIGPCWRILIVSSRGILCCSWRVRWTSSWRILRSCRGILFPSRWVLVSKWSRSWKGAMLCPSAWRILNSSTWRILPYSARRVLLAPCSWRVLVGITCSGKVVWKTWRIVGSSSRRALGASRWKLVLGGSSLNKVGSSSPSWERLEEPFRRAVGTSSSTRELGAFPCRRIPCSSPSSRRGVILDLSVARRELSTCPASKATVERSPAPSTGVPDGARHVPTGQAGGPLQAHKLNRLFFWCLLLATNNHFLWTLTEIICQDIMH